jgi:Uma2 family endonuclease
MALRPRYTFAEYLEIERRSRDVKHEYIAGEIFAMAGGSIEHAGLANAFVGLLFNHLRGGPCRTYSSDLQISIRAAEVATYADVAVVCDPEGWAHAVYESGDHAPLRSIDYVLDVDDLYAAAGVCPRVSG